MSDVVISIENLWKKYRLGVLSTRLLVHDLNRWWCKFRGKPDPYLKIGQQVVAAVGLKNDPSDTLEHLPYDIDADEIWALGGINLDVKQGEVLGIIGRNGAGKSTLLKILSRLTTPSFGEIRVKGRVASLLEVGTGFHPELTGRENIFLNGAVLGMTKAEIRHKFDEIVAFAELDKFVDVPVKRYSSGMYVRLAFAVAAHLEPEILIVDEVLAVGDAQFQKKCLGRMHDVAREGRTVLFVSHNMPAVHQLCTNGIVLSNGKLTYYGTAFDAVDKYNSTANTLTQYSGDGFADLERSRDKLYQAKIFRRIRLLDKNGLSSQTFPMFASIRIEVDLDDTDKYPAADYGIRIWRSSGECLTTFATWMYPQQPTTSPTTMSLSIPSVRYSPGIYRVDLATSYHTAGTVIDRVETAILFCIEPADVFNSGKEFTHDYGLVIPEGKLLLS